MTNTIDLENIDISKAVTIKETTIGSNRSGHGVTITKGGVINFGQIFVEEIGGSKQSLDLELVHGRVLVIRYYDDDRGIVKKSKVEGRNQYSARRILKRFINKYGIEEIKNRWIRMFEEEKMLRKDESFKLGFNSYNFEEDNGLKRRDDKVIVIDLLDGKGQY